jgi:hypothetical protein
MGEIAGLALSYLAGALSTLSPCVLPLLPIILFGSVDRHPWGPVALAAGLSFALVGVFVASIGFTIGLDPSILRAGVAILLVGAGAILLAPALQERLAVAAAPIANSTQSGSARAIPPDYDKPYEEKEGEWRRSGRRKRPQAPNRTGWRPTVPPRCARSLRPAASRSTGRGYSRRRAPPRSAGSNR